MLGKENHLKKRVLKQTILKKNDSHNGINPIRKEIMITMNIANKFAVSKKNI